MNDKEVNKAVEDVMNGKLAQRIKDNSKYATTGILIGAVAGIVIATFIGKCRICYGVTGGLLGGVTGLVISKRKNKTQTN